MSNLLTAVEQRRQCVAAGVDLLNRIRPGWEDEIDIAELNLEFCGHCILGQLCGGYLRGLDELSTGGWLDSGGWSESHGFCLPAQNSSSPYYLNLTREWVRQIRALRAEKQALRELATSMEMEPVEVTQCR